jgi:hypothetical protein
MGARARVSRKRFLATPMVVRDPSSNARWTVDAVLAADGLHAAAPLVEAATPRAAIAEARSRRAPVLLGRHVIAQTDFVVVAVEGLTFPRSYVLVSPAYGEATGEVRALVERIREHIRSGCADVGALLALARLGALDCLPETPRSRSGRRFSSRPKRWRSSKRT